MRPLQHFNAAIVWVAAILGIAAGAQASGDVDPWSGRLMIEEVDLFVPAGAVSLDVRRSLIPGKGGSFGSAWWLSLEKRLEREGERAIVRQGEVGVAFEPAQEPGKFRSSSGESLSIDSAGAAVRTRPDRTAEHYDASGRLVKLDLRNGNVIALRYDAQAHLLAIEGPYQAKIEFTLDGEGRITKALASNGLSLEYSYRDGLLIERKSNRDAPVRYAYDAQGRLTSIEDPLSGKTELTYDDAGRIAARRGADGATERWQRAADGNRIEYTNASGAVSVSERSAADSNDETFTNALGHKSKLVRDPAGHLLEVTGPTGVSMKNSYDALGRLVEVIEAGRKARMEYVSDTLLMSAFVPADGPAQTFRYDANGNLLEFKIGDTVAAEFSYGNDGLLRSARDRSGSVRFEYDAQGRLAATSDALSRKTQYQYDPAGLLAALINPSGGKTAYSYDAQGRRIEVTDPAGRKTRYAYDAAGRRTEVINPDDSRQRYEYDAAGVVRAILNGAAQGDRIDRKDRSVTITSTSGGRTIRRFDAVGRVVESIDSLGRTWKYEYDPLGRLLAQTLPAGRVQRHAYDAFGRRVQTEDGLGGKLNYTYDGSDRLVEIADVAAAKVVYQYDTLGRMVGMVDPNGGKQTYRYDGGDQIVETRTAAADTARFDYDAAGQLITVTAPNGGATKLAYDATGNLSSISAPGGGNIAYGYNPAGELTSIQGPGGTITLKYDAAGRLVEDSVQGGRKLSYRYAQSGQLLEVDDGTYPIRYQYDAAGRRVAIEHKTIGKTLRYAYDQRGLLSALTSPSGLTIRYRRDTLGRLVAIVLPQGGEIALEYDSAGRPVSIRYPNGMTGKWQYDSSGTVHSLVYQSADGKPVASWTYQYDAGGNPVSVARTHAPALRYRYDADGRLQEEAEGEGARKIAYAYRPGGDRASRTTSASNAYTYDDQARLSRAGDSRFAYDAAGRITERAGATSKTQYSYDADGQLVQVTADGSSVVLGYAPSGEQVTRKDAKGLARYFHDGDQLLEELDEQGRSVALYVHGPWLDRPLALVRGEQTFFYHADAVGSTAVITDGKGQVAQSYETDAFGGVLASKGNVPNPFIFQGREYDPDLKLYHFRARWYDPEIGRFLSPDPMLGGVHDPASWNLYAFARNAPTRFGDPMGLATWKIDYSNATRQSGLSESQISNLVWQEYKLLKPPLPPKNASPQALLDYTIGKQNALSEASYRVESALVNNVQHQTPAQVEAVLARGRGTPLSASVSELVYKPPQVVETTPINQLIAQGGPIGHDAVTPPNGIPISEVLGSGPAPAPAAQPVPAPAGEPPPAGGAPPAPAPAVEPPSAGGAPAAPAVEAPSAGGAPAAPAVEAPSAGGAPAVPAVEAPSAGGAPAVPAVEAPSAGATLTGRTYKPPSASSFVEPPKPGLTTGIGTGTVVGAVGGGALAVADCASRGGTARQCAEAGAVGTVVGAAGGAVITVAVNAAAQGTATGIVAAGGSAAAGAVGGTLVVGTVMIAGGYQTGKAIGNIIVQARSDSPQQIRGSDAAMAEADRRLTEVYELRKQFTDEAAALANETKKVTGLRDECAKLFAPAAASSLLPTGEAAEALNHLSENCTKAQTDLEALTTAGSDTLKIGQQASQMMATKEGPPESTETMRKVRGLIVSIRDTQLLTIDTAARGVANDLKPLAARLKAVTQYQDKEKELNQKVTAYDQATTGLQEKNGYVDGLRKRFDDAKANALAVLSPLEAQVVERDKARFADRLARIGKAEVGGEAQGQLSAAVAVVSSSDADKQNFKSAVSSAFRDAHSQWENETCAKFSAENGLANAGKAAQQSVEDVRSLLANLVAAFKERKQKLLQITKIDQETLAKGKTLLETEGDDAKRKIIENKMTNARDRKASVETENGELTLGQQDAEKAEQKAQATVTLLNVGGN